MRASLVSRELIADSIELMDIAHDFDALVCIVGCDKTVPARADGARADRQARGRRSTAARCAPGTGAASAATIQEVWEAVGARGAGQARARRARRRSSARACPGPGTCAGHFTANTMGLALEFLGLRRAGDARWSPPTSSRARRARPRTRRARGARWRRAGARRADVPRPPRAAERDGGHRRQRRLHQRRPAPARDRPRGRASSSPSTTSSSAPRATPVIANLTPGGRYVADRLPRGGRRPGR